MAKTLGMKIRFDFDLLDETAKQDEYDLVFRNVNENAPPESLQAFERMVTQHLKRHIDEYSTKRLSNG